MNSGTMQLLIGLGSLIVMVLFFFGLFWLMLRKQPLTQREQDEAERREYAHAERMRSLELGIPLPDESQTQDEEAARLLGESLRRAKLSSEAIAQVNAVFWAADATNRRALAHLVAGLSVGPVADEDMLAVVRGLQPRSESPSAGDGTSLSSTDIKQLPRLSN